MRCARLSDCWSSLDYVRATETWCLAPALSSSGLAALDSHGACTMQAALATDVSG